MLFKRPDFLLIVCLWWTELRVSNGDGSQEILIKNITQILDLLLQDYDNRVHPNYDTGRPTFVRTNMLIRSIGPVSEFDMDFSMDCYFRQFWNDPRLRFRGPVENLSLNIKMLEKIWRPDTYFHNGKNSYVHTITLPNKLLRLTKDGDILYSMRLTIKARCLMCLRRYPMDSQSCPLIIGSYAYTANEIQYQWTKGDHAVSFAAGIGLALSQFDLISSPYKNMSLRRKEAYVSQWEFSVLQVNFNLVRFAGYFLIQIYVPCILIVVLSFVGFFINREATSDRVGLGVTSILTLSTISLDSRNDLPKIGYMTALDLFLLMSFGFVMATLLEFASVHYFTKIGSGETFPEEEEWEEPPPTDNQNQSSSEWSGTGAEQKRVNCSIVYNDHGHYDWRSPVEIFDTSSSSRAVESKETQTEKKLSCFSQFLRCLVADEAFRRERQKSGNKGDTNSVSKIDKLSRVLFPVAFFFLNIFYWGIYSNLNDTCEPKPGASGPFRSIN